MIMHPSLIRAIVTACLANVPSADRQRFGLLDEAPRIGAEDNIAQAVTRVLSDELDQPPSASS